VVPALFESKPVFWILKELANRLELGEHFDFTMQDYRKQQLKNLPAGERALKANSMASTKVGSIKPSPNGLSFTMNVMQRWA
jgi:anaerobic selenocysteine-containing dehydrogenase